MLNIDKCSIICAENMIVEKCLIMSNVLIESRASNDTLLVQTLTLCSMMIAAHKGRAMTGDNETGSFSVRLRYNGRHCQIRLF